MINKASINLKTLLTPLVLIGVLIFIRINYGVLLFHTFAELFSVLVGFLMWVIAWNTRRFVQNNFLLYLGIGYFYVAVLDTLHTLTVKGMPVFNIADSEITLHFWIYTRLFEAFILLSASIFIKKSFKVNVVLLLGGLIALSITCLSFFVEAPIMLTTDGLTLSKIAAEYVVIFVLICTAIVYYKKRALLTKNIYTLLLISIVFSVIGEIFFTSHTDYNGIAFVIGHLLKFLSFWAIYYAIVQTTLKEPFSVMAQTSSLYNAFPHAAIVIDKNGVISQVNHQAEKLVGLDADQLVHQHAHSLFHPQIEGKCKLCRRIEAEDTFSNFNMEFMRDDKWFLVSQSMIKFGQNVGGVVQMFTDITERKRTEELLKKSEAHFRQIFEKTDAISVQGYDKNRRVIYWNKASEKLYGFRPEEAMGRLLEDLIIPNYMKDAVASGVNEWINGGPAIPSSELTLIKSDGTDAYVYSSHVMLENQKGDSEMYCIDIDLSNLKKAEDQVRLLSAAIEQSPISIIITDDSANIEYVNQTFEKITGYKLSDIKGKNPRILQSGLTQKNLYKDLWNTIKQGKPWNGELQNRKKNGDIYWEHAYFSSLKNSDGKITHYIATKEDITQRKSQEEKILHQAHFDSLTNLPNRFLSLDRLSLLMSEAKRNNNLVAILFIDLDDFKKVNDSLGHEMGDKLLIEAAHRLKSVIRDGDTVGRLGGDEFIILLGGLENSLDAQFITVNLLSQFREPFSIDGRELMITASVGISVFPNDSENASELLRNADSAMYYSKDSGRNTYTYFIDSMKTLLSRRLLLEEHIHGALERNEFSVFYQPKIDIKTGGIMGAEALLRWDNPTLGSVPPDEFISIAEHTGLIIPIGEFVIIEALSKAVKWQQDYNPDFHIAVNVSPRQFRDLALVPFIEKAIKTSGIKEEYLELEITEGVLMSGHSFIDDALAKINKLGISIAMDDFGTGYSSLSYLRSYPFDVVKIDRSFINDITIDVADRELTNAAIAMAHGLNLKVVAEGVETEEQLGLLKKLGCDYGQGYLFSRPIPAEEFVKLLAQ